MSSNEVYLKFVEYRDTPPKDILQDPALKDCPFGYFWWVQGTGGAEANQTLHWDSLQARDAEIAAAGGLLPWIVGEGTGLAQAIHEAIAEDNNNNEDPAHIPSCCLQVGGSTMVLAEDGKGGLKELHL